jgi:ABC-type uncharacterized transport system substrate-binding protein
MKFYCRLLLVWMGLLSLPSIADTVLVVIPDETPLTMEFTSELKRQRTGDKVLLHSLADGQLTEANPNLIITMGISALEWRLDQADQTPTIATYVSRSGLDSAELSALPPHVRAVLANPKPERQLRLAELLIPRLRGAGVLHSNVHAQRIPEWIEAAVATDVELQVAELADSEDLARILVSVLDRSDVLIGVDDPVIYNADNLKTILLSSYTRNRVLIGPSAPFIAAGSLSTTFSSPDDIARHVDLMITQPASMLQVDYPRYFSVLSNQQVARSMGFAPPDDSALAAELAHREGIQ